MKVPSYLPIVILYLLLRKDGKTLNRESVCDFCYINPEAYDSTMNQVENVFPQLRTFISLSRIGYRKQKEVVEEERQQSWICFMNCHSSGEGERSPIQGD